MEMDWPNFLNSLSESFVRVYYKKQGIHINMDVFVGNKGRGGGKAGELIIRETEWDEFRDNWHGALFIEKSDSD